MHIDIYIYVCIYIYVYIYTYFYIYIYIYGQPPPDLHPHLPDDSTYKNTYICYNSGCDQTFLYVRDSLLGFCSLTDCGLRGCGLQGPTLQGIMGLIEPYEALALGILGVGFRVPDFLGESCPEFAASVSSLHMKASSNCFGVVPTLET